MSLNTVYVCQKFFSNPLILITLAMTILFIGVIAFFVQVFKTRAYLKKYLGKRLTVPESLKTAINNLDLGGKVDIVKDPSKFSFCYGIFKPRICLSTGLIKAISWEELKAVLVHESYHVKNYDPLKIILGQTASLMFFFIPSLKEIQQYFVLSKEIAADEIVIKNNHKKPLLSVLSKLLTAGSPKFAGVVALANLDDLEKRILYLTGNQRKAAFKLSLLNIALSTFIVLFLMILVNAPVYAVRAEDSCKAEEVIYNKNLMYTPASYTPNFVLDK